MTRISDSVLEERRQKSLDAYAAASSASSTSGSSSSRRSVYVHSRLAGVQQTKCHANILLRPVPRRGKQGNDILGPQNPDRMRQEPDHICPPETDHGKMPNMKW